MKLDLDMLRMVLIKTNPNPNPIAYTIDPISVCENPCRGIE
jgi:hypothetical protein